jgi:hypothetical protein
MEGLFKAWIRQLANTRSPSNDTLQYPEADFRGQLLVSDGFPYLFENVRLGEVWTAIQGTTTVFLAVALPTTVAQATLFNNNSVGGKCLVLLGCTTTTSVSEGAAAHAQLFVEPSLIALTSLPATADTGTCRGYVTGSTYGGGGLVSKTVTVTDNGWIPVGGLAIPGALATTIGVVAGGMLSIPLIIKPGYYAAAATTSVNATGSGKVAFHFMELQIPGV